LFENGYLELCARFVLPGENKRSFASEPFGVLILFEEDSKNKSE